MLHFLAIPERIMMPRAYSGTTVTVSAEISGKIISLDVTEGDNIIADEMVGAIDTTALVLRRKQLQSQMASIESSRPDIAKQIESLRQQIAPTTYGMPAHPKPAPRRCCYAETGR